MLVLNFLTASLAQFSFQHVQQRKIVIKLSDKTNPIRIANGVSSGASSDETSTKTFPSNRPTAAPSFPAQLTRQSFSIWKLSGRLSQDSLLLLLLSKWINFRQFREGWNLKSWRTQALKFNLKIQRTFKMFHLLGVPSENSNELDFCVLFSFRINSRTLNYCWNVLLGSFTVEQFGVAETFPTLKRT